MTSLCGTLSWLKLGRCFKKCCPSKKCSPFIVFKQWAKRCAHTFIAVFFRTVSPLALTEMTFQCLKIVSHTCGEEAEPISQSLNTSAALCCTRPPPLRTSIFFPKMRLPRPLSLLLPLPLTHVCSSSHACGLSIRKKYLHKNSSSISYSDLLFPPPPMGMEFIHILWEDVAQPFSPVENVSFCKYQRAHSWSLWVRASLETILRSNITRANCIRMICFTSQG